MQISHHETKRASVVRRAFSLVEMLVAMALSLLIILAVTQVFRLMGDNVLAGRAVLEMSGQLRGTAARLQNDLDGLTVPCRPWPSTSAGLGYFEYYEGPFWDMGIGPIGAGGARYSETSVGDIDDVLMFTARAVDEPFVGQILGTIVQDPLDASRLAVSFDPLNPVTSTIQSRVAEIVWFTSFNDWNDNSYPDPGEVTLHRRTFLVTPNLNLSALNNLNPLQFYSSCDISVRTASAGGGAWIRTANSLEDLGRRENRIAHNMSGGHVSPPARTFPNHLWRALLVPQGTVLTNGPDGAVGESGRDDDGNGGTDDSLAELGAFGTDDVAVPIDVAFPGSPYGESFGNDVMLSYLLAFDVKAYDPTVPVRQSLSGVDPLLPGDPGYDGAGAGLTIGQGGYVDLFYARYLVASPTSTFSGFPNTMSGLFRIGPPFPVVWTFPPDVNLQPATYDTWTLYYEQNGLDEDGVLGIDQGKNSLDDNGLNGVDDVLERETSPPYPVPMRGIQIRLRLIDNDARQVRQVTVASDFIPE